MKYKNFRLEGDFYSMELPYQMNLLDAKQWIRNWLDVMRLPNNTEIY